MRTPRLQKHFTAILGALLVLSLVIIPATASHDWNSSGTAYYHWARTSNPFILQVGDNLTKTTSGSDWDYILKGDSNPDTIDSVIDDWNKSSVLDLKVVAGETTPKQCKPKAGKLQACNATYGNNGWLGLAQIWISSGHITQGTAKQNDTYFNRAPYNTDPWRRLVLCQEIAHVFGLDHQDETHGNTNLGSCMDYTNAPAGGGTYGDSNEHPNDHDYAMLETMYGNADGTAGHFDSSSTVAAVIASAPAAGDEDSNDPKAWGRPTGHTDSEGRPTHFEKDLGGGHKLRTFVIWAEDPPAPTGDDGTGDGTGDDTGDGGRNDGGRNDGGKRDGGKKADSKQDGGKNDGGKRDGKKQRQHNHDGHNH